MMNWTNQRKMFVYPWHGAEAWRVFSALADQPYSLFFDSNRPSHSLSRYSYICWKPFETIECKDGRIVITNDDNQFNYSGDPFVALRERLALRSDNIRHDKKLPPFQGGAAGFFGYDLGRSLEKIPSVAKQDESMPDMCVGLYDKILAYDHTNKLSFLIINASDENSALGEKDYIESLKIVDTPYHPEPVSWHAKKSEQDFKKDISKVIDYIYAGDIFQANLSRRFTAQLPDQFNAYTHYTHLRQTNSAPFSAFMNFGDVKLASCSPERFLNVTGRAVETRPIKGTLPSSQNSDILRQSQKDKAENAMIVDLMRNDLSKTCEDHSVEVTNLCNIETFEGLHHMVSTVQAKLKGDKTAIDVLRACFPGGSITGAPKIRAMEIIEELEPDRRGPYCGAMGFVGFDGTMDTNVAIRTLVYNKNTVSLQTGGGIVSDSDPVAELNETLTKADKIFSSFDSVETKEKIS